MHSLQIVDQILKRFKVLGFGHPFSVTRNLCSLGRGSIGLSQDVMRTVFGQDVRALNRRSLLLDVMTAAFRQDA
ncbi:hypothetical protein P9D34_02675 [Bacillus swezeyi]|uniref:hypothetical protein n=1 Tax=Bacillus swezeyi TaxID=1925020 RepID=UPI000F79CBFB|nr:hypothetical protein [Bacillus swezeyi]MEC1259367.1 hypothetical protein [Bacillus swezeyi]MED2927671.1 hypothetical protein [Bacillus swezeyi]MED2965416.1 hypothetical protein [Bacillus swezeyi]MED3071677.1 hypothetical protein [Bacillus swezeyi]MED3080683.1 hypothetical protein [Bacillus swezeyi]